MAMDIVARTPAQLGAALKSARVRRGLTQADTASNVGLRQKTVSSLENVGARTTVGTLYKMLAALGLELVVREKGGGNTSEVSGTPREW
jgi:HTH-type transcriptional regulator / antitoxin HipB